MGTGHRPKDLEIDMVFETDIGLETARYPNVIFRLTGAFNNSEQ